MQAVRDKEGLTYGIGTSLSSMEHGAMIVGHVAADNAKAGRALNLLTDVWNAFYSDGPSDDEIAAAKNYLTGALPLGLTSTDALASVLVEMQMDHLGRDYLDRRNDFILKVGREDVLRVIERWFNPDI